MHTIVFKLRVPLLVGTATSAFAASTAGLAGHSMLVWFFIGFGAMILMFQAAPAMIMFCSMLKGLFSTNPVETTFSPLKGKHYK